MKELPTTNRPCKGRGIAWSRTVTPKIITVRAFKRDSTGRSHMHSLQLPVRQLAGHRHPRALLALQLLACRAQVRWAVDQVDFQLLGLQDTTPPPTSPWLGGQVPPFPAPAGHEWIAGSWGFNCSGKPRQDPPRLVPADSVPQLGVSR